MPGGRTVGAGSRYLSKSELNKIDCPASFFILQVMEVYQLLLLVITGALAGFYAGLMGTGANIILIPMLDFMLSDASLQGDDLVKAIIAHSLCITLFSGGYISFRQYRVQNFYLIPVVFTALPGMITAAVTTYIIKTGNWYNKHTFDLVFLSMLILLLLRLLTNRKAGVTDVNENLPKGAFWLTGAITGIVTSLSGFGGGIVMIPFFTDIFKMPIRKASSISIGVIALLALPISITYLTAHPHDQVQVLPWQFGYISFAIVLPTLLGIFSFAPLGVKTAQKMNPARIRLIFSVVVAALCGKIIWGLM